MKRWHPILAVAIATAGLAVSNTPARAMTTRETSVFNQLNSVRTSYSENALSSNTTLYNCAKSWAQHLATPGTKFDHNPNLGSCIGSGWTGYGENLASGPAGYDVVSSWLASACHFGNIIDSSFSHVGVAVVVANGIEYWVADYGDSASSPSSAVTTIQDGCMQTGTVDGVAWSSVRALGQWNSYHSSGGAAFETKSQGLDQYVAWIQDPDPGIADFAQVVKGVAGKTYTLSAKSLWFSGTSQQMYLDFLNSSYGRISDKIVSAPTTSGSKGLTTGPVVAPAGTAYVRVILYGPQSAGFASTYYWFEVMMTRS